MEISKSTNKRADIYTPSLEDFKQDTALSISTLEEYEKIFPKASSEELAELIENINVADTPLVDYWLNLSGQDEKKYTQRLKNKWLKETLEDKDKSAKLISLTLDKLQSVNSLIERARTNYRDILENEKDLTPEQKEILIQEQDSKLFFLVISKNMTSETNLDLQLNTIDTVFQLSSEKEDIRKNALNNIFKRANNPTILQSEKQEDVDIVDYIFELISQKISTSDDDKEQLERIVEDFKTAQDSGNYKEYGFLWKQLVNSAQQYFDSDVLDDLTSRNIVLLNSFNKNMQGKEDKRILKLIHDNSFTIEQKEFISRYKDDRNFRLMIDNPNVDISKAIEELVFFEAGNRNLINQSKADVSENKLKSVMSDKFNQINRNNKDINIQGDRIVSKLDIINDSISDFSDSFTDYATASIDIQEQELQQLIQANKYLNLISDNTSEIKSYTQALTRAALVNLEKDRYYKEIVPEITKLLPEGEQVDLEEFLSKVDKLAKNEKNSKRKKLILKAGVIVAATAAVGAGAYFFGPEIIAYLTSAMPSQIAAAKTISKTISKVNTAKMIGNSGLISFLGRDAKTIQNEINQVQSRIKSLRNLIKKYPNDTSYGAELDRLNDKLKKLIKELSDAVK